MAKKKQQNKDRKMLAVVITGIIVFGICIAVIVILNNHNRKSTDYATGVDANTLTGDAEMLSVGEDGVRITSGGIYTLSEDITNGSVVVATEDADVQLILDGITIANTNGPAIFVESADNVYIELKGENKIIASATKELNAAIYSKEDLLISGEGSLEIDSTIDGIVSKDDLQIDSGKLTINAKDEGIVGKDSIKVTGGDIVISASSHGLKTSNEDEKGNMEITGGNLNITSGIDGLHSVANLSVRGGNIVIAADDDGVHADSAIEVSGGVIDITKSYEGIEAGEINVSGGDIKVVSRDDGFNAAGGSDSAKTKTDPFSGDAGKNITISGGKIYINASGDGIDSNGNIYIAGGTTYVDGPTDNGNGPMDYGDRNCEFVISGGTLIAVGSAGMAVNATAAEQPSVLMNLSGSYTGDLSFGSVKYSPSKAYNSVLISSSELKVGNSYNLVIDGKDIQSTEIKNNITNTGTMGIMPGRKR